MIQILVLTREQCHWCDEAKAALERLATVYDVSVDALDITTPEGEALALRSGVLFPPGVFLDGTLFSYGRLPERKLRETLERRGVSRNAGQADTSH
jgi:glutaredoxin